MSNPNFITNGKLNMSKLNANILLEQVLEVNKHSPMNDDGINRTLLVNQGVGWYMSFEETGKLLATLRAIIGVDKKDVFVNIGCNKGEVAKSYLNTMTKLKLHPEYSGLSNCILNTLLIDPNREEEVKESIEKLVNENIGVKYLQYGVGQSRRADKIINLKNEKEKHEWVITEPLQNGANESDENVTCTTLPLNDIWNEHYSTNAEPSYIRLMTNTNELEILKSFEKLINKVKVLSITLNSTGYNFEDIYEFLNSNEFTLFRLSPNGCVRIESGKTFIDKSLSYRNYIAIKNSLGRIFS